jgi:hypothetical protein
MVDSRISTITGNAKQVESINLYLPVAWLVLLVISFLTPEFWDLDGRFM